MIHTKLRRLLSKQFQTAKINKIETNNTNIVTSPKVNSRLRIFFFLQLWYQPKTLATMRAFLTTRHLEQEAARNQKHFRRESFCSPTPSLALLGSHLSIRFLYFPQMTLQVGSIHSPSLLSVIFLCCRFRYYVIVVWQLIWLLWLCLVKETWRRAFSSIACFSKVISQYFSEQLAVFLCLLCSFQISFQKL